MGVYVLRPALLSGKYLRAYQGKKQDLKPGDIITEINGRKIASAADMERALAGLKSGDIVTILFLRAGETKKSEIIV